MMCAIANSVSPAARTRRKMFGLPMQLDASVWFVVVAVLLAGIVAGAMHMVKESRMARARLEMDSIRSAVLEYEAYTGADIGTGTTGIPKLFSEFKDQNDDTHKAILQKKGAWSEGKAVDPWGTEYSISGAMGDADRKIQCTGSGETFSVSL